MSLSHLCFECVPEGTDLGLLDLKTDPPRHCNGRSNTTRPGLIGGYSCSCRCAQQPRDSGQHITPSRSARNGSDHSTEGRP